MEECYEQNETVAVYTDLGITHFMQEQIKSYRNKNKTVEYRTLAGWQNYTSNKSICQAI